MGADRDEPLCMNLDAKLCSTLSSIKSEKLQLSRDLCSWEEEKVTSPHQDRQLCYCLDKF